MHDSLIFSKVKQKKQQDFIAKAAVNDGELKDYYDKNKESLKVDDQMKLSKIYIARGQIEAADLDKYTTEIAARIKTEGFEKVALELNGKKGVTVSDLGWVETADMSKNVRDALKDPKKGKITDPIDTPSSSPADNGGYQIIKITDYKSGKVPEFTDVKEKVRVRVIEEKVDTLWNEWIDTVKKKAYINYM